MKVGVVGGSVFFVSILKEMKKRFEIRTTKHYRLMKWSYVTFFECGNEYLMWATQLKKRSKIMTRLHSYELTKWAEKIDWNEVDTIIFVSNAMRNRFLNMYPNLENRTIVIYTFVDTDKFKPKSYEFRGNIGSLSYNISPIKRVYELILAFYEIQKENNELNLHIGGRGEGRYYLSIKELIERLGLKEKIFLDGYIRDVVEWHNTIDIFISHSYWGGFHMALQEAMACGCYPLAHFWSGVEEFMPKENIYITNNELNEKILDYCN